MILKKTKSVNIVRKERKFESVTSEDGHQKNHLLHHNEAGAQRCTYTSVQFSQTAPHYHEHQDFEQDLQETVFIPKKESSPFGSRPRTCLFGLLPHQISLEKNTFMNMNIYLKE